ncbi:MAG: ligand-binding sensor domain-containing protein, partial [Saprospiraceae bacterium]
MKISILFSFLTFACAILSFAQSDCITFISGEDITTITDDTEYIWLGTTENGLVRMDKSTQEKVYFDTGNSNLPVNDIQSVMIFENQTFTGTEDEISVLQGEDFYTFSNEVGGLS